MITREREREKCQTLAENASIPSDAHVFSAPSFPIEKGIIEPRKTSPISPDPHLSGICDGFS